MFSARRATALLVFVLLITGALVGVAAAQTQPDCYPVPPEGCGETVVQQDQSPQEPAPSDPGETQVLANTGLAASTLLLIAGGTLVFGIATLRLQRRLER